MSFNFEKIENCIGNTGLVFRTNVNKTVYVIGVQIKQVRFVVIWR